MVQDSAAFGSLTLGVVIGLVVLLYGVALNAGQSLNSPMIVGGIVVLASIGFMGLIIARL